jgi:hypothetical protein
MSGLPPIDLHDNEMLPAVYRHSEIIRSANVAGRQPSQGRIEGQIVVTNNSVNSGGYTRSRDNSPMLVKQGNSCPKGMIIDVWA